MQEKIGSIRFSHADVLWFAHASGDWNPIHVDPVKARRSMAGEQVVHGMFALLSALEMHLGTSGLIPTNISAFFRRTIMLGTELDICREKDCVETKISIVCREEEFASCILIGTGKPLEAELPNSIPERCEPRTIMALATAAVNGLTKVTADISGITARFPHVVNDLGALRVAGIMALSRLVGMEYPGLHSLFTGLDVVLDDTAAAEIKWESVSNISRLSPLGINFHGAGLTGKIQAFMRPRPVDQPSTADLSKEVGKNEFVGQKVLVLGGSRGLGEIISKTIAAGGGDVILTYNKGIDDAQAIVEDITSCGGICRSVHYDNANPHFLNAQLDDWHPTHMYYFVTPKIRKGTGVAFDQLLYETFLFAYVFAFEAAVREIVGAQSHELFVFYPSTTFIDKGPEGYEEYISAKIAGEEMCLRLQLDNPKLNIIVDRLPPVSTDQTASLIPQVTKPALQEVLRIVKAMRSVKVGTNGDR
jgi:MaoC like domain